MRSLVLNILVGKSEIDHTLVDENLFYKGVDKKVVHGARLHQTHSLSDPTPGAPPPPADPCQPPYPFTVCAAGVWKL